MGMIQEFRTFIARGNVMDLAVGVIIGGAFGKIVTSLTQDVLMPVLGVVTGGLDFSNAFIILGKVPASYKGSLDSYDGLKAAGVAMLGYGAFVTAVIDFLLMAFVIFLIVRAVNRMTVRREEAAAPPPAGPSEIEVLVEIRDAIRGGAIRGGAIGSGD